MADGPAAPAGLLLEGVSHAYGAQRALEDVSLSVAAGEVLCLLGPSGCGKSTLLRLAAGIEPLQAGRVAVAGRTVADARRALPPEARGVGMVFQDYALFPHLTVLDNVAFGLHRLPGAARRARAIDLLERVELRDRAGAFPHVLSGGEQQRVALARALAPQPLVMLLDEPFAGLDTRLRQRVRDDTLRLLHDSGAAVLLVTHDPDEAMAMGDRLAVMRRDRLEHVGPPADVYARPASAFVARFLGETNTFRGTVAGGAVATPLGPVPAPDYADGTAVDVHVRLEAIALAPFAPDADADAATGAETAARAATVERVRQVGAQTIVDLRLPAGSGAPPAAPPTSSDPPSAPAASGSHTATLRAVCLGPSRLAPGDCVSLSLRPGEALVFPIEARQHRPQEDASEQGE